MLKWMKVLLLKICSKEIPYEAVFSDLVNSNEIDDGDEFVIVDEPMC